MSDFTQQRQQLVEQLRALGITNQAVLDAMLAVPRHEFTDSSFQQAAYCDTALPIGSGQTISQPYIVAIMTQTLLTNSPQKVLEIGTGSGYQAAVLAELVPEVFTIERIESLYLVAQQRLKAVADKVECLHADGNLGWPKYAPYDAIMITAAIETIPQTLLDQLVDGGRLVAPVGDQFSQRLCIIDRNGDDYKRQYTDYVIFVPMLGGID